MSGDMRPWILGGLAAWLAACSPLSPDLAPMGQSSLAGQADTVGASVLTGGWDAEARAFVIEAYDSFTGGPAGWDALRLPGSGRQMSLHALSPDGSTLAVVTGTTPFCAPASGGSACWPSAKALHFIHLPTRTTARVDPGFGRVSALAFSPDGQRVALVHETREAIEARLYDPSDGQLLRSTTVPFVASYLGYTVDGQGLLLIGAGPGDDPGFAPPGPLTVMLIDGETLESTWRHTLDGILHGSWCLEGCGDSHEDVLTAGWSPAIVRIPGTDRVVIVHADADRLTSIDAGGQRVTTMDIAIQRSWIDRLMALGTVSAEAKGPLEGAFRQAIASTDGSRLYTVGVDYHARRTDDGQWEMRDEPLGLQVIDPSTGLKISSIDSDASRVALTKDGAWLLLTIWGDVELTTMVLPVDGLDQGRRVEAWELVAGQSLEGIPLVIGLSSTAHGLRAASIDPMTLEIGRPWRLPGRASLLLP